MNVLVLTSSPRSEYVSTQKNMLNPLIKGMKDGNANVDVVDLTKKVINTCQDCTCCMTTSIGKCVMQDDMTKEIMPLFLKTDVLVLATPIYFGTLSSTLKKFIERLFPLLDNHQAVDEEGFHHNFRVEWPKVVVVATASWDYPVAFEQLSSYFRYLFADKIMAELYRGNHNAFAHCDAYKERKEVIVQALYQVGKQIAESRPIDQKLVDVITGPLAEKEKIVISHNLSIDSCIELGINITEWTETGKLITPGSLSNFIDLMRLMYHPENVERKFVMQFEFTGKVEDKCYFIVGDELQRAQGTYENGKPEITIKAPFQTWTKVMNGSANCLQLLMRNKISIEGDMTYLNDFQKIFYMVRYY